MKTLIPGLTGVLLLAALAAAVPPTIQPIPDWVIDEDAMLTVNVVVEDPDSDQFLFWAETNTPGMAVNFDVENRQVHCHPDANWSGQAVITVGADDMDDVRTLATEEFTITVTSVNDCPRRLSNMPPTAFTFNEDQCYELSRDQIWACFTDPDWAYEGDTLDFENLVFSAGTVEPTATGFRLCSQANWNGNATLSLRATDGECGVNSSLPIKVMPVNDCPVQVAAWEPVNGFEDTDLVLTGLLNAFQDVDLNALTFCILDDGVSGFVSGWTRSGTLTLSPPPNQSGVYNLYICVTDGFCQVGSTLQINLAAVNDAPQLPAAFSLALDEDGSLIHALPVSDVDSPSIYMDLSSSVPQLSASWSAATGLQLIPQADWNGAATITVRACDAPNGAGACSQIQLPITVRPVNDAPLLTALADRQFAEDGYLSVTPDVSDIDSPSLTVDAQADMAQLEAHWLDETGELLLTPAANWNGQSVVTVTVSDGAGGSAQDAFLVNVSAVNDAPVLPVAQTLSVNEDGSLDIPWLVTDVDGPQVAVTAASNTEALSATWLDGQLSVQAADDWNGEAQLTLTACDGFQSPPACVQQTLAVTVLAVNDAPTISELGNVSFLEDSPWEQAVSLQDIDSAELSVQVESSAAPLSASWLEAGSVLRLVPQADWFGTAVVTVTVNDNAARALAQRSFTATVLPVNDAPVLPAAQALSLDEDGSLDIPWIVADVDGPQVAVTVESNTEALTASWLNGNLSVLATADWSGEAQLTLSACDGFQSPPACVQQTLAVTVLAVNDAPTISELGNVSFLEDSPWELVVSLRDIDSEELSVQVESSAAPLSASWLEAGSVLRLVPQADWFGTAVVTVTVNDNAARAVAQSSFTATVLPVNDAPVLPASQELEMAEDGSLELVFAPQDVDGPSLDVTVQSLDAAVAVSWLAESGRIRILPAANWNGETLLTVSVCDNAPVNELCAERVLPLTVLAVNDAPQLPDLQALSLSEDGSLLVDLPLVDVDGPAYELTAECDQPAVTLTWLPESSQLRLESSADWNGQANLSLSACDGHPTNELCDEISVALTVLPVNDSPYIDALADQTLAEDGSLSLPVVLHDIDSGELLLSVQCDQPHVTPIWHAAQSQLELTPQANWSGVAQLTVTVSDEAARLLATRQFTLTVTPVNDAPVLPELDEILLVEDTPTQIGLTVLDVDGPQLQLTVASDTPELQANWLSESGQLHLAPAADWTGVAHLTLQACDLDPQNPACDERVVQVTVSSVNDSPIIETVADQSVPEDDSLLVPVVFHDVDNNDLDVSVASDQADVVVSWLPADSHLLLVPTADWSGQAQITVTVSDAAARLVAVDVFTVVVTPVNDAPVLSDLVDQQLTEDTSALLELNVQDVDGPGLDVTVACDTPSLVVEWLSESAQLRLSPAAEWSGQALVTVTVCDANPGTPGCDTGQFQVTVLSENDAPWIGVVADQTLPEDGTLALPLDLSDVDSESLTLGWSCEPAVLELTWDAEAGLLSLAPQSDWNGSCLVTLSLDDQAGRTVTQRSFNVLVSPQNDAPYVRPCVEWSCGVVDDPEAFRLLLLQGGLTLDLADVDGDALELVWFVDGSEISRHALGVASDTLTCLSLPAPPEEWLTGSIVLHAELTDGTLSLNPGGESCAWELDFTGLSDVTPLRLALEPAWPNPFNPTTQIPFVLETAGDASLTVYDLRGARVAVLAQGWHAAGRHEVRWNAGRLASGVYLAVLETAGESRVQRMTLLK